MDDFYDFIYQAPQPAQTVQPQLAAPQRRPRQKKRRSGLGLVALALCCSLLGGAVGAGAVGLSLQGQTQSAAAQQSAALLVSSREQETAEAVTLDSTQAMSAAEVYEANVRSTVGITTEINGYNYFGFPTTSAAAGSGFVITESGYVLTNYHVVEGASAITVTDYDGESYDAALIGYDADNDVAVLKIEASGLKPVVLGDSDTLRVGDTVLAIGNPLGELTFSLTAGVVSALDREITMSNGTSMTLIQTDCAINSGNSGGALFNLYGEVVGITNAKYSGSSNGSAAIDNIGFAIPISRVMSIVEQIIDVGYAVKPYLGVSVGDAAEDGTQPAGAAVSAVVKGSPAEKAGLQGGDIIFEANGETIADSAALVRLVAASSPGDSLLLCVYRGGETLVLTVTVGEKPQAA